MTLVDNKAISALKNKEFRGFLTYLVFVVLFSVGKADQTCSPRLGDGAGSPFKPSHLPPKPDRRRSFLSRVQPRPRKARSDSVSVSLASLSL